MNKFPSSKCLISTLAVSLAIMRLVLKRLSGRNEQDAHQEEDSSGSALIPESQLCLRDVDGVDAQNIQQENQLQLVLEKLTELHWINDEAAKHWEDDRRMREFQISMQKRILEVLLSKPNMRDHISPNIEYSPMKDNGNPARMLAEQQPNPRNLALLIDCENIGYEHAHDILRVASSLGKCYSKRIYGDFNECGLENWKLNSAALELEMVDNPKGSDGKCTSAMRMVVDTMDMLHSEDFDGFVLVSVESDFMSLAGRIRACGKFVKVIEHKNTRATLPASTVAFIGDEAFHSSLTVLTGPQEALPILKTALEFARKQGGWAYLSAMGQQVRKVDPDFNPVEYGSPTGKLIDLVRMLPEFETTLYNKHYMMRLREC